MADDPKNPNDNEQDSRKLTPAEMWKECMEHIDAIAKKYGRSRMSQEELDKALTNNLTAIMIPGKRVSVPQDKPPTADKPNQDKHQPEEQNVIDDKKKGSEGKKTVHPRKIREKTDLEADILYLVHERKQEGMGNIMVYENIQNSVDAHARNIVFKHGNASQRSSMSTENLPEVARLLNKTPEYDCQKSQQYVIVVDDGSGMSMEDIVTKLLIIGNGGQSEESAGTYGTGKAAFMLGSENYEVVTVKDGMLCKMSLTCEQYLNSLSISETIKIRQDKTDLPNGTAIQCVVNADSDKIDKAIHNFMCVYSANAKLKFLDHDNKDIMDYYRADIHDKNYRNLGSRMFSFHGNVYTVTVYETKHLGNEECGSNMVLVHFSTFGIPVYATEVVRRRCGYYNYHVIVDFSTINRAHRLIEYPFIYYGTSLSIHIKEHILGNVAYFLLEIAR